LDTKNIYIAYKISRLVFAFLLLSFFIFLPDSYQKHKDLIFILVIYNLVAVASLFFLIKKISVVDFYLDVVFISAVLYVNYIYLNYLAILFLFPILLYALLTGRKDSYILSAITSILYGYISYKYEGLTLQYFVNITLIICSLFIINYAGLSLYNRIKEQKKYISMLEKEKKKNEVFQRLYRISADFAHELRNPMTSLLAAVELIDKPEHKDKMVEIIKLEGKRIEKILNTFLTFSRPVDKNFSEISIKRLVEEILYEIDRNGKSITMKLDKYLYTYSSKESLKLVLKNIIQNAFQWAKKSVVISAMQKDGYIVLNIEDDGKGIEQEDYEKIFEPFFTKRQEGTGLGLAIAKKYIIELGGDIKVEKSKLGGAKFVVIIPVGEGNGK